MRPKSKPKWGESILHNETIERKCHGCGACCQNYEPEHLFGAWLNEEEYYKFSIKRPDMLKVAVHNSSISVKMKLTGDKRCIALSEDNLCTIYEDRPKLCKDFAKGGPLCIIHLQRLFPKASEITEMINKAIAHSFTGITVGVKLKNKKQLSEEEIEGLKQEIEEKTGYRSVKVIQDGV